MKALLDRLLKAAHHFTITDFAVFKVCLLSIGILLGTYFINFFRHYLVIIWIIAIIAIIYIFIQIALFFKR